MATPWKAPRGRYFYSNFEPVIGIGFFQRHGTITRTRFGYFVKLKHVMENYKVGMRLPAAKMLTEKKYRRRLARAKLLEVDYDDDYSDDEFLPLPGKPATVAVPTLVPIAPKPVDIPFAVPRNHSSMEPRMMTRAMSKTVGGAIL